MKANQTLTREHEQMIQKLWQAAEERLRAIKGQEERLETIEQLLLDAALQLGGGPLRIQVAAEDHEAVAVALPAWQKALAASCDVVSLDLEDETPKIWGGVIVRRTDVRRLVDNSFNARLLLVQRQLRDQVYRRLARHAQLPKES